MDSKKIIVKIFESAKEHIKNETKSFYPKETGGVLIGYWKNQSEAVITNIIGPGPKAKHTLTSFIPDDEYHIGEIAKIYKETNCKKTYLGDWHSHPNSTSYLSDTDKKTLRKIAKYKPARLTHPIMLVYGTKPEQMNIWLHEFKGIMRRSQIDNCILVVI